MLDKSSSLYIIASQQMAVLLLEFSEEVTLNIFDFSGHRLLVAVVGVMELGQLAISLEQVGMALEQEELLELVSVRPRQSQAIMGVMERVRRRGYEC